ncbi:MAG: NAD(P)-dependent oxidoreductase [Gammaproteobacteria bacterium]
MCISRIIGKIHLSQDELDRLLSLGVNYIAKDNPNPHDEEEIINRVDDSEVIIVNISVKITKTILQKCNNLRFIQTWSTGVDHIDIEEATKKNIIVKNVPDFSVEAVAEKTLAMMIFISNKMREANLDAIQGNWNFLNFQGIELKGKTLVVVGAGRIGNRVAELATAFGMNVMMINSKTSRQSLHEAFSMADFITLHCPLTKETHYLIGETEFKIMKNGVFFINNSRGGVVNEAELLKAINSGIVAYASVDVLEQEPPTTLNPLASHPKIFLTPHTTWNTKESVQRLTTQCIDNLEYYIRNKAG